MSYYKNYHDPDFNQILNKYEFSNKKMRDYIFLEPNQMLLRNIVNPFTVYDKMLLFHATGTGKTLNSIAIAEGFSEYLNSVNRRVFVLVKNDTIQKNFIKELMSKGTEEDYLTEDERYLLSSINPYDQEREEIKELKSRIKKKINQHYEFFTYGKFTNNVLGITVKKSYIEELEDSDTEEAIVKMRNDSLQNLNNTVVIVDEVHNILGNKTYTALMQLLSRSYNYKLILLTATPLYDNVEGIIWINNLLNADDASKQLTRDILESHLVDKTGIFKMGINTISDVGIELIKNNLLGKVSYLRENESTNPQRRDMGTAIEELPGSVKIIKCDMSHFQYEIYTKAIQSDLGVLPEVAVAIDNEERTSSLYKNSSDASTMVYPNGEYGKAGFYKFIEDEKGNANSNYKDILNINSIGEYSSKLYNIINSIINGEKGNIFIYSNFVTAGGTNLIKYLLLANGFKKYGGYANNGSSFIVMDDSVKPNKRESLLRIFNSQENCNGNLIRIIIGSPVLSEGITLKCIKQIHILEPFWNMSKINQIIGRGIRNNSHVALPENERFVEIYKYASVYNNPDLFYIDLEKYKVSEAKDRSNKVIERVLKEVSIDCQFTRDRNIVTDQNAEYTDKCDYTTCAYKCVIHNAENIVDKSTYTRYIKFFEKYDINYIKHAIRFLYKEYFMYTLDNIYDYLNAKVGYNLITIETLLQVLEEFITDKIVLTDIHAREGFLVKKGIYYIFNSFDKNINDSIFQKMFDFSQEENLFNINEYSLEFERFNIDKEDNMSITPSIISTNTDDITDEIIEYNNNLMKAYDILGSYRKRPTTDQVYGNIDNQFRLIDFGEGKVSTNEDLNGRRKTFGTIIGSGQTKKELHDIAIRLGIPKRDKETKDTLSVDIRKFLVDNNRVLQ